MGHVLAVRNQQDKGGGERDRRRRGNESDTANETDGKQKRQRLQEEKMTSNAYA